MPRIWAASHPGKMGDALYVLPTLRYLAKEHDVQFDFYTSDYCAPLKELFEYQSCINKFIINTDYKIQRMDMGCQPWYGVIPRYREYERRLELGFRQVPDRAIHQYIAHQIGIEEPLAVEYEVPEIQYPYFLSGERVPYITVAPRGDTTFGALFDSIAQELPAIIVGGKGDYRGYGLDYTGTSMLLTAAVIKNSVGFVGLMSSQLVLANGFPIKRIAPHDGKSWDMRHVVNYYLNYYPIHPSLEDILNILKED